MFYEKLAEAKEEKKPRSTIAGNLLGLGIGGGGAYGASRYMSRPQRDFEKNLKGLTAKHKGATDSLFDTFTQEGRTDFDNLFAASDRNRAAFAETADSLRETLADRMKHRPAKALAIGGLGIAGGIGAKKLYDRYNQRKQQREE